MECQTVEKSSAMASTGANTHALDDVSKFRLAHVSRARFYHWQETPPPAVDLDVDLPDEIQRIELESPQLRLAPDHCIFGPYGKIAMVIVADGIYYALALIGAGGVVWWLAGVWLSVPLWVLAAFCLYFFRDPERNIPGGEVAVSPADGKVVAVKAEAPALNRVSVFLNIFDVHVNRSPVGGIIASTKYQKGKFRVASRERCSAENEQNIVTVRAPSGCVVFKQIAGLIARRIVFTKKPGDQVAAGERVGLIKFGSRVDVMFGPEWEIVVRPGMRVLAGSSIIARRRETEPERAFAGMEEFHGV
jgi:phosphatidylserine decarboxylase